MMACFRCRRFAFHLHRLHGEPLALAFWRCLSSRVTRLGTPRYWAAKGYGG